ncbi:MAG TPA: VWA domain-containing protein [Thermoanaerobaculia bacterium]|nr:VWA domain-containing protein [Thermoanaerobaculia bacterium]
MDRTLRIAACVGLLAAVAASAVARTPDAPVGRFTATAGTEYVQLPVVVRDRKGAFVDTLKAEDFHVWVDGKAVAADSFEKSDRAPVSFAILLDVSGSMAIADKLERAKEMIQRLVTLRQPGDDFALFTFSEDEVRIVSNFDKDPAGLLRQLLFLKPVGKTALYDAVIQTSNELLSGTNLKKAILLFTDGVDNASVLTTKDIERVMENESVPVYAIGMKNASYSVLNEEERKELSLSALDLLAQASGGRMFLVSGDEDLRPIAVAIDGELRRQYVLGFQPSGEGDVKYWPIVVTVKGGGTRVVRARRGYRGTAPKPLTAANGSPQHAEDHKEEKR